MLESVLADILTRILGQYLEGIDRDSVRFGAWSGLVELRGVALRSEALAVLFEALGLDLPVTVDAGFIGLLRLQVPWKTIGTTSVQIHMEDITIVARPVRGDGSDNSELENRERRIQRAKLITDDAVREASWGVSTDEDNATSTSWSSWLLSDQLRAKIVDNIQIHLKDIILRFEDHFSNPQKPYIASVSLKSLKAISVNELWTETFVERKGAEDTRKLLEIIGFRIDWAPITPEASPGPSKLAGHDSELSRFKTPQLLRQFLTEGSADTFAASKKLLHEVDGSMRLRLSAAENYVNASQELREQDPVVDLDIRFPEVHVDLDDVQYASILQTSVYFARLSTRGVRPQTAKARWVWAINQLLPGFSTRRSRALRFSEKGIAEARDKRVLYVACRKSLLKARRNALEEPKDMLDKLESIEGELSFTEILAYRDRVDRIIEREKNEWSHVDPRKTEAAAQSSQGTTTSSFWKMLGYSDDTAARRGEQKRPERHGLPASSENLIDSHRLSLRIGFLLRGATLRLCQGGYPVDALERVALKLRRLHIGVLYAATGELVVESLVGGVEAWDLTKHVRMVYSRLFSEESQNNQDSTTTIASYPHDVTQAIETIRSGSNPARDVLIEETLSDGDQTVDLSRDKQIDPIDDQQSPDLSFTASEEGFERAPESPGVSDTEKEDSFVSANVTHRVTEAEFLGNPKDTAGSHKYIAAFRFTKQGRSSEKRDDSSLSHGTLEVSVATLEAVVDGPKGSFLWGLKFWRPKGMVRDPIMAFLGAAAGARIAELRIELEEALLANRVPMQINAVIMAPRFIIPGNSSSDPAFVVNMGTLGVCTSENSSRAPSSGEPSRKLVRYSNYVLTLDDLGVYFCPGLSRAVSSDLSRRTSTIDPESHYDRMLIRRSLDTTDVERIIRPFSLRFVLQTLRDSSVVQVAHSSSDEKGSTASNIAKVRVRGTIPGLSVILTLKAFQHLAAAIQMWSEEVYSESDEGMQGTRHSHSESSLPSELFEENMGIPNSPTKVLTNDENRTSGLDNHEDSENRLTAMASYDIKVLVQKVSLDVRQTNDMRLVTTVADEMVASIVKTSSKNLAAEFSLGSLSVTDGSRGSTAAFRRLLYAGNLSGTKGVSPPRSLVDLHDEPKPSYTERYNFVTFKYDLDLLSRDQTVFLRFLSLNMVCVRETYVRIGMFLSQVREYVKSQRKQRRTLANEAQDRHSSRSFLNTMTDVENVVFVPGSSLLQKRLSIISEFAGFHLQLVASGGTVAVVEMQDSRVFFNRSKPLSTRLWGDFRLFSVQDLTATVDEHMAVITYNRPSALDHDFSAQFQESEEAAGPADEWSLTIPATSGKPMSFKAAFRGIRITYLARFSDVIRQYMSVLVSELQPVIAGSMDGYEVIANDLKATAAVMSRLSTLVVLQDLVVRLPRHSNCNSEAVNIRLSRLELTDQLGACGQMEWAMNFFDLQMAVEYLLCDDNDLQSNMSISSTFLCGIEASLIVGQVEPLSVEGEFGNAGGNMCASLTLLSPVRVNLCEAQYTVLYFVLTENLAETVSGLDVSTGAPPSSGHPNKEAETSPLATNREKNNYSENVPHNITAPLAIQGTSTIEDLETKDMIFKLFVPFLSTEISRGWDVAQESCKVIGLYMKDVRAKLRKSDPYRLLIEVEGYLLGLSDLRAERGTGARAVAIPLLSEKGTSQYSTNDVSKGNLSLTYDKEGSERPSIVVYMTEFEFELSLSLFGDITYLAVPGWPFLQSSSFAPDLAYLGRTMNILLSESQIVLRANEFEGDCRAIVLTGEFLLKVDWKRLTGAKRVSIRSSQFEICTSTLQPRHRGLDYFGVEVLTAEKVKRSETPLAYPTDSFLEYVGPDVDDDGRRIEFSVDAFLCVICATEIPLLRAVATRLYNSKETYLTTRDWVQPAIDGSGANPPEQGMTPKEKRIKEARENTNLFINIPAVRYLLTDDREGRFVSILEVRLGSISITAHGESMIQVGGEASLDLFNADKGWWEPAIEAWDLTASMSRGHSGTRAFVIRSDRRLNVNFTPTTISASMAVATALKSITTRKKKPESRQMLPSEASKIGAPSGDVRRPSIAAFLVRNELGIPVNMSMPKSSRKTTIANNTEVEVGAESESLLTSTSSSDGRSREKALRCLISLVTSVPVEVSASEIGVFPMKFSTFNRTIQTDGRGEGPEAASAVWDVQMIHGVPVCTVRSPLRIGNDTNVSLEINVMSQTNGGITETQSSSERITRLEPGKFTSISLMDLQSEIMVRPSLRREHLESNTFEWSDPLPNLKQLKRSAYEAARLENGDRKPPSTMDMRRRRSKRTVVCKSHLNDNCDFYLAVATKTSLSSSLRALTSATWVDVTLQAPVVLENKLPERLGYRIFRESGAVLAAGLVKALQDVHLHISRDALDSTFVSLAYDNRPRLAGVDDHDSRRVLSDFGTAVSLADLRNGKVVGACTSNYNAASQKRALTLSLLPNVDGSHMTAFAGYWVRNRSDTAIEICSRSSFYGTGSGTHVLRQRPPTVEPDNFVCCEGPYLSVRLPLEEGRRSSDRQDQSGWWTSTTVLYEANEPFSVVLPGRTLELEVRPAEGLDCPTYIITIRNSTWIVNRTNSPLQWCQASALDAHGNCPTRLLNSLPAGESQALHWQVKASERAVHFRLADSVGQSDWIWSPAIPINIRSSRELPAKMYRPKTHEQYIARISVKEIAGNCKALVVRKEDRQNPPYRIINLCKERAIAFRQISSQERHWLLRAGKTTRYSWDDPLASRENRLLSVRVVAPDELVSGNPIESGGSSSSQRRPPVHTMFHDLPIDVVGNSTISSLDVPQNPVNVKIAVDRATKVVTFADADSDQEPGKTYTLSKAQRGEGEDERSNSVLIVGWEEIKRSPLKERRATTFLNGGMCDYPAVSPAPNTPQNQALSKGNIDIAVFLESVGVSIVDAKPCELIYVWYQTILFNYQTHEGKERYSLSISDLQADNQLCSTSFPVLLSISSNMQSENGESFNESSGHAIVLQVHRDVTNDDILMITSFQADIRPANVYLEDRLVSRAIRFLSDSAIGNNFSSTEILSGEDRDCKLFKKLTPGDEYSEDYGDSLRPSKYRSHAISASRRIYVREFNISSSLLRLTSAGSGNALAKAAGLPISVRALVGMLLNVENCEFSLAALTVQNEFDSMHHFLVRVRKFYVDQFNKQRMKLLASNSLMGNPAALFDAVGTGARVLMNEPGRAKGSSEFIASVGRGSKSLFAHTVGGIVDSVSGIPRALSSGIEAAVGDKDYLAERQRIRGHTSAGGHRGSAAKTPAQGLATGAVSFAHGISSGVHGFIREPVQGAKQDGARGLLKGIGKAFIGGVAKPVAGGMDFVFEPVAGLSRQIRDSERSNNAHFAAVPDRPPRAFHGRNPRLEVYDKRYALGVFMFETTQIMSRVSYSASLIEWVELSARNGRAEKDSEVWVWEVVQRATRKVPGTKVKNRKGDRPSGQEERGNGGIESRPEKIRVALVTETEVIVTTLDCRLIDVVPLWEEAIYTLHGDGKDLLIRAEMPNHNGSRKQESSASLQGNQPLISAPWDASTLGNRKKPSPGSECTDRIACGSFEARNDLRALLAEVTKSLGTRHDRNRILKKNEEKRSSGVELSCVDDWSNANEKEMRSSDHDEHLATSDISRLNWTLAGKSKGSWTGSRRNEMERTPASLEKTVRRLSMSGLRKSEDSRHDLRMILANKLASGLMLRLSTSNLEHGVWRTAAADAIEALDAQVIDVGSDMEEGRRGMEVSGVVVYDIVKEFGEIDDERENEGEIGQIVIEFFRGKDEAASFTTRATRGYQAEFVSGGSRHGSAIFTITETAQGQKARLESNSGVSGVYSGRRDEAGSSSKATASGMQNRADGPVQARDFTGESDSRVGLSDDEMLVQQLVEIGFKFEDAVVALAEAGGDMVKAVDILTK